MLSHRGGPRQLSCRECRRFQGAQGGRRMISHRFRRRAFLGGLAGGVGLKVMLRNAELSGQTAQSPPRFLATYWPLAIVPGANNALWTPTKGPAGGYALQPFLDNGLADDMITLRGISTATLSL